MPASIQTRLDLPVRKSRRPGGNKPAMDGPGGKQELLDSPGGKQLLDSPGGGRSRSNRGRALLVVPSLLAEEASTPAHLRTPRRGSKARNNSATPRKTALLTTPKQAGAAAKRSGADIDPAQSSASPPKSSRRLAVDSLKENAAATFSAAAVNLSPSVHLARLTINSPRVPLSAKTVLNDVSTAATTANMVSPTKHTVKRGNLFSPEKLTGQAIEDLLFSPGGKAGRGVKAVSKSTPAATTTTPKKNNISVKADLFGGGSGRNSPAAEKCAASPNSHRRSSVVATSPLKSTMTAVRPSAPKPSPLKIATSDELESLLCSPVKLPTARTARREDPSPQKRAVVPPSVQVGRSPRKLATPVKSPRKGAANLFNSPSKDLAGGAPAPAPVASTPPTPAALFKADVSQFQTARQALHTGTPSTLLCRGEQVEAMSAWLDTHLVGERPGSLYVSGAPGTGKTATLTFLLNTKLGNYRTIFINCMVLKSSLAIYKEVARQLLPKKEAKTEKEALKMIESAITAKGPMILLVLDEIDQLESKNQDVLYSVFEWPALLRSRAALVGIANTLDLTDRVLPRLQVKEAYTPTLLHYPPYTKPQIIEIITKRLADSEVDSGVINPRAIAFLAGKISSLSGDIRKALDVCRRALEQAETSSRRQTLLKPLTPRGLNSPTKSPHKGYKVARPLPQVGQVDLPHIMKVFNQVYGSKLNTCLSAGGGGIPTQQKILMASLLLMVKRGRTKEVTLGRLVETYGRVCKKRGLAVSEEGACVGMVQMLESRGMVSYTSKGAPRYAKVTLRLDEKEVEMALEDKTLLSSIVDDIACLPK